MSQSHKTSLCAIAPAPTSPYTTPMPRLALLTALLLAGCAHTSAPPPTTQSAFLDRLQGLCGKAFGGRLVTSDAADGDMAGAAMVMHVRACSASEIRIPFHVQRKDGSWDRSRTWVITRTGNGLRLKHDHRHDDGVSDAMTMYGGDTADAGTATRQTFPVDATSIALFQTSGRGVSVTNVWAVEVDGARFAYELRRTGANARHFRVEFALATPIAPPPPPWGSEGTRP